MAGDLLNRLIGQQDEREKSTSGTFKHLVGNSIAFLQGVFSTDDLSASVCSFSHHKEDKTIKDVLLEAIEVESTASIS